MNSLQLQKEASHQVSTLKLMMRGILWRSVCQSKAARPDQTAAVSADAAGEKSPHPHGSLSLFVCR